MDPAAGAKAPGRWRNPGADAAVVLRTSSLSTSLRAKRSNPFHGSTSWEMDCFVASAPLRKRFAFVAGNDALLAVGVASLG